MSKFSFIEDIFLEFALRSFGNSFVDYKDTSPIHSFYETISDGTQITKAQALYILKILSKYQNYMKNAGFDYHEQLQNPQWKNPFRILDLGKNVFISSDDEGTLEICLKFPFAFKSQFERDFLSKFSIKNSMRWDPERKINILLLYQTNLPLLYDYLIENGFTVDESFLKVLSEVEEIWQTHDSIEPKSLIENQKVKLKNADEDVISFWSKEKTDDIEKDLILAKSMGYKLQLACQPSSIFEKIASSDHNSFWCKDFSMFFEIYKKTDGVVAVILDRSDQIVEWLTEFVNAADSAMVSRSEIKVCFRDDNKEETKINVWIKENQVGGKIDSGKIFIFRHKPAKWLFNGNFSVKIIATNSLFPMTNTTTQRWIDSHYFVIYLGSIRAAQIKEKQIVEL